MAIKIWLGTTSGDYSVAANWSPSGVPTTADDVLIQGTVSITAGLNQSAVAINSFVRDPAHSGTVGSVTGYLQIDPDSLDLAGTGLAFIDIGAAAISPTIRGTASAATGAAGLYLKGTAIATLNVLKGSVGLALLPGEVSTVTTVNNLFTSAQASDANTIIGSGVTITNLTVTGGTVDLRAAATTILVSGGTLTTRGAGAITTLTNSGGVIYPTATGTITTAALNSGTTDFRRSRTARTVTTLTSTGGDAVIHLGDYITLTNKVATTGDVSLTIASD